MIWEFYKFEKHHGKDANAFVVSFGGRSRRLVFCNNPKKQRKCKCQQCGTEVPREVPRLKLDASYYYGAGYYCLSCARVFLKKKVLSFRDDAKRITDEADKIDKLINITEEVIQDEWYEKKMAMGRLGQVIRGEV